jgi:hypothetical protein
MTLPGIYLICSPCKDDIRVGFIHREQIELYSELEDDLTIFLQEHLEHEVKFTLTTPKWES